MNILYVFWPSIVLWNLVDLHYLNRVYFACFLTIYIHELKTQCTLSALRDILAQVYSDHLRCILTLLSALWGYILKIYREICQLFKVYSESVVTIHRLILIAVSFGMASAKVQLAFHFRLSEPGFCEAEI